MTPARKGLLLSILAVVVLVGGSWVIQHDAQQRADKATAATIGTLEQTNRTLVAQLRAHGITPAVSPIPGAPGAPGGTGGTGGRGANGGPGGKGGTGGRGGNGGRGGPGGDGAAVVVQLTPAPGPAGSPGSPGSDGRDGSPGPAGSPGAQGPPGSDDCTWVDDPLHPGSQVCSRPSPTPQPAAS